MVVDSMTHRVISLAIINPTLFLISSVQQLGLPVELRLDLCDAVGQVHRPVLHGQDKDQLLENCTNEKMLANPVKTKGLREVRLRSE